MLSSAAFRSTHSPPLITAVTFVRKMKGSSQPLLIEGTDRHLYVVKMQGNVQNSGSLASELVGGILCKNVGICVAESCLVQVDDHFIDCYPNAWFHTPVGRVRPPAGLHYGTAFVGTSQGAGRPIHLLNQGLRRSVRNRDHFCGIYLFDIWANHLDRRQNLYTTLANGAGLDAVFLDNGRLFDIGSSELTDYQQQVHYRGRDATNVEWRRSTVRAWVEKLKANIPPVLADAFELVPPNWWINNSTDKLQAGLLQRLDNLEELIKPFALEG